MSDYWNGTKPRSFSFLFLVHSSSRILFRLSFSSLFQIIAVNTFLSINKKLCFMDYRVGQIGRVFTVRMDHGEDLTESLKMLASKENIQAATFVLLGAIETGNMVVGPKKNERPPNKMWTDFDSAHEIVGVGNLFHDRGEPVIHLHAGLGRAENGLVGCVRKENKIFMVIEAFVFELTGFEAERIWNDTEGYAPITFK